MPPVAWAPQAGSQTAFLSCPVFECLYAGTAGLGKTSALLMDFAQFVGRGYGRAWRGVLFRRTFPQLRNAIDETKKFFPRIFPSATYNEVDKLWKFPRGEELVLRFMEKPSDYWNYHGWEIPWVGFEELTTWPTDECWKKIQSRCRSPHRGLPLRVRGTTNPSGPGHNWVKARYNLPVPPGKMHTGIIREKVEGLTKERIAIRGHWKENKILLEANPDYPATLAQAATSPSELAAWLHGSWDVVSGGMFDDVWAPKVHVVDPFPIPSSWTITRAFDWGSAKPFSVGWWARSDGTSAETPTGELHTRPGDMFRILEWYGWTGRPNKGLRLSDSAIAAGIVERELVNHLHGRVRPGPADSAIFVPADGENTARTMAKPVRIRGREYPGVTWQPCKKGAGSRASGWALIRDMLEAAAAYPREKPGLFVFSNCRQFVRTVPTLPRDDRKPDDVDTDAEDHCFAAGTLVVTCFGTVPIEDVGPGWVRGPDGGWYSTPGARLTRRDAALVEVTLSNGHTVHCTPDHEWLTADGRWVETVDLTGETCYSLKTWNQQSSAQPFRSSKGYGTTCAAGISKGTARVSTVPFGRGPEVNPSPMGSTFITSTMTVPTIGRKTFNFSPGGSIAVTTDSLWRRAQSARQRLVRRPVCGTAAQKGVHGTQSITSCIVEARHMPEAIRLATTAPGRFEPRSFNGFARTPASRPIDGRAEKTMWADYVKCAARRSGASSTANKRPALEAVVVLSVQPAGTDDVYCLEAAGCFQLASGPIVSNCADEARYQLQGPRKEAGSARVIGLY